MSVYSSSSIFLGDNYVGPSSFWLLGTSHGLSFFFGAQMWGLRTKWWQFPKWWKEMDSSLQGSMCALGRCAEVPPCSPISLLSSRFRSRAPFGVLGSQMDQTHTHTGVMLTLSQDVCGPWWIRLFIGWTVSDFHPEHSSAYLGTFHLVHRGDISTPDFPLGIPPRDITLMPTQLPWVPADFWFKEADILR